MYIWLKDNWRIYLGGENKASNYAFDGFCEQKVISHLFYYSTLWNVSLPFGLCSELIWLFSQKLCWRFFTVHEYWNIATARVWKRPYQRRDQTVTSLQFKDCRFDKKFSKNSWKCQNYTEKNFSTFLSLSRVFWIFLSNLQS